ncbi:MAG: hypothetical protein R2752_05340 [Vicinamibacterales bacterium]
MKHLVILGARRERWWPTGWCRLGREWDVTVVDPETHLYQPSLLFLPFGAHDEDRMLQLRARTLARGVAWRRKAVQTQRPRGPRVLLESRRTAAMRPAGDRHRQPRIPVRRRRRGLLGAEWHRSIHDFYTLEGAQALRSALATFTRGRLVVNVVEMPIKVPGRAARVPVPGRCVPEGTPRATTSSWCRMTPLDGAFTKPTCNRVLSCPDRRRKGITIETEFNTGEVDADGRVLRSCDDREVPYDLLVTIPSHSGRRGRGRVGTRQRDGVRADASVQPAGKADDHVFVLGDATDLRSSKAGSVAHFQAEERPVASCGPPRAQHGRRIRRPRELLHRDEASARPADRLQLRRRAAAGQVPGPCLGPMDLLRKSRVNHWSKLAFRWLYWNALLPGRPLPVSTRLSMRGQGTAGRRAGRRVTHPEGGPPCCTNTGDTKWT